MKALAFIVALLLTVPAYGQKLVGSDMADMRMKAAEGLYSVTNSVQAGYFGTTFLRITGGSNITGVTWNWPQELATEIANGNTNPVAIFEGGTSILMTSAADSIAPGLPGEDHTGAWGIGYFCTPTNYILGVGNSLFNGVGATSARGSSVGWFTRSNFVSDASYVRWIGINSAQSSALFSGQAGDRRTTNAPAFGTNGVRNWLVCSEGVNQMSGSLGNSTPAEAIVYLTNYTVRMSGYGYTVIALTASAYNGINYTNILEYNRLVRLAWTNGHFQGLVELPSFFTNQSNFPDSIHWPDEGHKLAADGIAAEIARLSVSTNPAAAPRANFRTGTLRLTR